MPTKTATLAYPSAIQLRKGLPRDVLMKFGNGVFVSSIKEATPSSMHVQLGAVLPEIIEEPGTDKGMASFLRLPDVSVLRFTKRADNYVSDPLDREGFFERLREKNQDLILRAEHTLLRSAREKLVQVQPIGIGLNPIREVLITLNEEGSFPAHEKRYSRYVRFLTSLGYMESVNGKYHPGPELQKFTHALKKVSTNHDFYDRLMGELLERGYKGIVEGLRIQHLVPIVRAANAYYWPSAIIGKPLTFRVKDFISFIRRHHPTSRVDQIKLHNHLLEMDRAGIIRKEGTTYKHVPEVWTSYQERVQPILPVMAA